ncbi:Receptor-like serine/threonine-protein [Vigna angularis]|uniref:Receptor-like serine/threonine-protein n=1 Tax=Phaseolus angularis TaxID=3914 RepID=A0A8T0KV74_PHAAN|nr:Receptor-like serine/threonine-protein [Vigna angularis]
MDSPGSIQGEREFHNELTLCSNLKSPFVISLLDEDFGAKIGDFGLARVKAVEDLGMVEEKKEGVVEIAVEEFGVTEEGESVSVVDVDRSPESCPVRAVDYSDASPVGGDKTTLEPYEKSKSLSFKSSMLARLKLKGIHEMTP